VEQFGFSFQFWFRQANPEFGQDQFDTVIGRVQTLVHYVRLAERTADE